MVYWFHCAHKHTSFPITLRLRRDGTGMAARTYVVCLDCGREFPYSWEEMKMLKAKRPERAPFSSVRQPVEQS